LTIPASTLPIRSPILNPKKQ